ncbi:hypothetical protein BUALT_Bualt04G0042600 [Buddleja alternifolia]|uniref:SAC domain-containing protein n=1 Tax=Buddleja alternifolia TaxID=168488 RepID=A0AAV6XL84_9LAMI|nr:hypothetical protein BUALT_Bualt04G0042600 [Buddleja alternifolia]
MMEKADPTRKLYTRMRLWEFADQYVLEPTDGSSASSLAISRLDGSMNLIDDVLQCSSHHVQKIWTIYGVVGMIKLLAGMLYSFLLLLLLVNNVLLVTILVLHFIYGAMSDFCPEIFPLVTAIITATGAATTCNRGRGKKGDLVGQCTARKLSYMEGFSLSLSLEDRTFSWDWSYLLVITERECVGSYLGYHVFKIISMKVFPCDHSLKISPEAQKKMEIKFSRLLNVAERSPGLYFSYDVNITLRCLVKQNCTSGPKAYWMKSNLTEIRAMISEALNMMRILVAAHTGTATVAATLPTCESSDKTPLQLHKS